MDGSVLIGRLGLCEALFTDHDEPGFSYVHARLCISMFSRGFFLKVHLEDSVAPYCECIQN